MGCKGHNTARAAAGRARSKHEEDIGAIYGVMHSTLILVSTQSKVHKAIRQCMEHCMVMGYRYEMNAAMHLQTPLNACIGHFATFCLPGEVHEASALGSGAPFFLRSVGVTLPLG
jgi:hypothetical protein